MIKMLKILAASLILANAVAFIPTTAMEAMACATCEDDLCLYEGAIGYGWDPQNPPAGYEYCWAAVTDNNGTSAANGCDPLAAGPCSESDDPCSMIWAAVRFKYFDVTFNANCSDVVGAYEESVQPWTEDHTSGTRDAVIDFAFVPDVWMDWMGGWEYDLDVVPPDGIAFGGGGKAWMKLLDEEELNPWVYKSSPLEHKCVPGPAAQ